MYLINCAGATESAANTDVSGWPVVNIVGFSEWRNPYGYLSGSIYGYLAYVAAAAACCCCLALLL